MKYSVILLLTGVGGVFPNLSAQTFIDAADSAGINHVFNVGDWYYGGGASVLDYNNDGWEDFYITGGASRDVLYRNNGDGTFDEVSALAGLNSSDNVVTQGAVAGDIDNDGDRDIYVTVRCLLDMATYAPDILYRNNGDGTFTDISVSSGIADDSTFSRSASFGDYNLDGYIDLYVCNFIDLPFSNFYGYGGLEIAPVNSCGPDHLYINNGDNTFTDIASSLGVDQEGCSNVAAFTDYDNDSDLDILVGNDFAESWKTNIPNILFENKYPVDHYSDTSVPTMRNVMATMGIAVGDYNEDGKFDYYMTDIGPNRLFRNNGNGVFDSSYYFAYNLGVSDWGWPLGGGDTAWAIGWGCNFLDFNRDTYLDMFVSNGGLVSQFHDSIYIINPNSLYKGSSSGNFDDVSSNSGVTFEGYTARGSIMSDYDKDGDIDLLVVEQTYPAGHSWAGQPPAVKLFMNQDTNSNNWLKVKLVGTENNKDGLGSKVRIVSNGRSFIREIDGGSSLLSNNTNIAFWGLGSNSVVDTIEVTWLGGNKQRLTNVTANQLITITEVPEACIWSGQTSGDWSDSTNWVFHNKPTSLENVVIRGDAVHFPDTYPSNITVNKITLKSGAQFVMIPGANLTVSSDLIIEDGATLTVTGTGGTAPDITVGGILNCNGAFNAGSGKLIFNGSGSKISGSGSFILNNVDVVGSGSKLSINQPATVGGVINVKSGATLITGNKLTLHDGASLLHGIGTPNGGGAVTGNVTVKRTGNTGNTSYNFWSSPVAGSDVSVLGRDLYYYDPSGAANLTLSGWLQGWIIASGTMAVGKGYTSTGGGTVSFSGAANNANTGNPILVPVEKNDGVSNDVPFNLIGNPFPSSLDAELFIATNGPGGNGIITGSLYFWDDDNSGGSNWGMGQDYGVWSGAGFTGPNSSKNFTKHIASGQGFFVEKVNNGVDNVEFRNSMRSSSNNVFFKQIGIERFWLNLTNADSAYNETLIAFINDATDSEDLLYDAKKLKGNEHVSLYSKIGNRDYAIQALSELDADKEIELGLEVASSGTYKLSLKTVENLDESATIILEDRLLGEFRNLRKDPEYEFTANAGSANQRFFITVNPAIEIKQTEESCVGNDAKVEITQGGSKLWDYILTNSEGNAVASGSDFNGSLIIDQLVSDTYNLALADDYGYEVFKTFDVQARQKVVADFETNLHPSAGQAVQFVNFSSGVALYEWSFGDGMKSNLENPVHSYAQPGDYQVKLAATGVDCNDEKVEQLQVSRLGTSIFNTTNNGKVKIFSKGNAVYINFNFKRSRNALVAIFTPLGQQIYTRGCNALKNDIEIDLDDFYGDGIYLVEVIVDDGIYAGKVFIN